MTAWRNKKDQLDMTNGITWSICNWSQDALSARKCVLNDFWHIFVYDGPVDRCAMNTLANAQRKSVFSLALTVMDNIVGWEEERKWVGSLIAACMWIYTKTVLCNGRRLLTTMYREECLQLWKA